MRPILPIALAVAPLLAAGAANASETVSCSGVDGSDAVVEMNIGRGVPADVPNWVRVGAGGKEWSTLGIDGEMTQVSLLQSFDDGRLLAIDITDPAVEGVALSLRILRAEDGENVLRVGYLKILGSSLHPIVCDFGETQ